MLHQTQALGVSTNMKLIYIYILGDQYDAHLLLEAIAGSFGSDKIMVKGGTIICGRTDLVFPNGFLRAWQY